MSARCRDGLTLCATPTEDFGGEAVVRTVAPGFSRGESEFQPRLRARFSGRKSGRAKASFRPLKRAHEIVHIKNPQLNAGGYGSYGGFAADPKRLCESGFK
jgi:hypothetical protein